jgi:restriction endonuclease S subunit
MKYVSINDYNKYREKHQPIFGDILLSNIGTIGKSIVVDEYSSKIEFLIHWNIFKISPKKDLILPLYLKVCLDKLDRDDYYKKFQTGGTLSFITKKVLVDIEIPLPPLEVQEEIVRELEQYQKIIDGAKQVVDNYKPVIDIDPSWEMKELGDTIAFSQTGLVKNKGEQDISFDYPYIKMGDMSYNGEIVLDKITKVNCSKEEFKKYKLEKFDLLFNTRNTPDLVGKTSIFNLDIENCLFNNNIMRIRFNEKFNPSFVCLLLNKDEYKKELKKNVSGTTSVAAIYPRELFSIKVPIPPLEIQLSIVERIEGERQIIEGNKKLIEIYTQKIQDRINKIWGE